MEYPIGEGNSPPIKRIDEGKIYNRFFTIDGDLRPKYIVSKYLCPKYYAILYLQMAYTVNTPRATLL